jgi:uncharacterized membrane protein YhaH (DUF805 family)
LSAVNPYTPPRAHVDDVLDASAEQQEPSILSARGRIGRLRYLAYTIGAYLVLIAAMIPVTLIGASTRSGVGLALLATGGILYFVFTIMAAIQRVHDFDWSGWSVLLFIVPFANLAIGLMILFRGGTEGANRFGPPPTPNTWGVRILGCIAPLAFVGIIAAVALPAYNGYVAKAKAAAAAKASQN